MSGVLSGDYMIYTFAWVGTASTTDPVRAASLDFSLPGNGTLMNEIRFPFTITGQISGPHVNTLNGNTVVF